MAKETMKVKGRSGERFNVKVIYEDGRGRLTIARQCRLVSVYAEDDWQQVNKLEVPLSPKSLDKLIEKLQHVRKQMG